MQLVTFSYFLFSLASNAQYATGNEGTAVTKTQSVVNQELSKLFDKMAEKLRGELSGNGPVVQGSGTDEAGGITAEKRPSKPNQNKNKGKKTASKKQRPKTATRSAPRGKQTKSPKSKPVGGVDTDIGEAGAVVKASPSSSPATKPDETDDEDCEEI